MPVGSWAGVHIPATPFVGVHAVHASGFGLFIGRTGGG